MDTPDRKQNRPGITVGLLRAKQVRAERYAQQLAEIAAAIREQPLTILELSRRFGVLRSTMHARVLALRRHGYRVITVRQRAGRRGPLPEAYRLV